jgi:hypothetical protein
MAEDEQFKIDRFLRQTQDREYQESLERDQQLEVERARHQDQVDRMEQEAREEEERKAKSEQAMREKLGQHNAKKQALHSQLDEFFYKESPSSSTSIGRIYDWVFTQVSGVDEENFVLATSYPSCKFDRGDERDLSQLGLVPNAVLLCSIVAPSIYT